MNDLASQAQAEAGTDSATLMTPQRVEQAMDALLSGADGVSLTGRVASLDISGMANVTSFANADEFAMHDATVAAARAVTYTAFLTAIAGTASSTGLRNNGAGSISLDIDSLTNVSPAATDEFAVADASDSGNPKAVLFSALEAALNHDSLTGFVAAEHTNHSSVSVSAGNGLTGGGTIASTRTLTLGTPGTTSGSSTNAVTTSSHTHALDDDVYRGSLGSAVISAQSGGSPSGGSNGDIILIY